jgi:NADH-quinone oxidoreductase subunit D
VKAFCRIFPERVQEYETILNENRIWLGRTVGVGVLTAEEAKAMSVTGPILRGSGVKWDIRKAFPYEVYDELDWEVPVGENGDTYDRYLVRMEEMKQSRNIVLQAVERLPDGLILGKVPKMVKPPVGEVYHSIESPKGELGVYVVSNGTQFPERLRIRPPSLINLQALKTMSIGHLVADVIALIGTIDIVLGEVDR